MAFLSKLIFAAGICVCLTLCGCRSTPTPTGDRLVSVSWVNQNPGTLRQIQTEICGTTPAVLLEVLPGYTEKMLPLDQPLFKNCNVALKAFAGTESISLGTVWLDAPKRKSQEGEYNLRIQILHNMPIQAGLEPAHLTRTRLQ